MRRLHVGQIVTLSLDDEPRAIRCGVINVRGSASRLACRGEIPPSVVGRLVAGWPGYLVFKEFGMAVGLRVAVRASPPDLNVAVTDGIAMPERRTGERVELVTRVRITGAGTADRGPAWTDTINLSEYGALLREHPALADPQPFSLELMFGDDPRPVTAQAEVIRRLERAVGVTFRSIPADDATRMHEYLMGLRHERGRPATAC